jgi:tetratricopeptide (TPR) repeat protein
MTNEAEQQKEPLEVIINRGFEYDKNGQKDEAIAEFTKAIDLYRTAAIPYEYRAQEYAMRRDSVRAQKDLEMCVLIGTLPSRRIIDFVAQRIGRPVDLDRARIVIEAIYPHPFYWIKFQSADTALACLNATSFAHLDDTALRSPQGVYFHISRHPEDNTATLMIGGELITLEQMSELYSLAAKYDGKFVKAYLRKKTESEDWSDLFNQILQNRVGPNNQLELVSR